MQQLKKDNKGFTIIEVMIVLVIAAVIILIVFLAVPALQRNSRNNQRKSDVARLSTAYSEYMNNNNGSMPTTYADVGNYAGTLGFYTIPGGNLATADQGASNNADAVIVARSSTCTTANGSDDAGTDRQFAIVYALETGNGSAAQCLQG